MLSMYCPNPTILHNEYVKNNYSFPRLCAAPIGVLTSLVEVEKLIINTVKEPFQCLNAAGSCFSKKQLVKSIHQFQVCADHIIFAMVSVAFFQIPNCAIRVILSVVSPHATNYRPDTKTYTNITENINRNIREKFIYPIDVEYNFINANAAKAPVWMRIVAIANCVIEALSLVCMKPIASGLYLKEAVKYFEIRDPRLSLYLVRSAVVALLQTIPAAVFAAPQCLLQCCASLYDPRRAKSIYSKITTA